MQYFILLVDDKLLPPRRLAPENFADLQLIGEIGIDEKIGRYRVTQDRILVSECDEEKVSMREVKGVRTASGASVLACCGLMSRRL